MPHSLNDGYDRGGIILTSNKSYGEWGSTFGDPIIATAILDRLLHHSTTINIRRESSFSASRSRRILPGLARSSTGTLPQTSVLRDAGHWANAAAAGRESRSKTHQLTLDDSPNIQPEAIPPTKPLAEFRLLPVR